MKRNFEFIQSATVASLLTLTVLAQDSPTPTPAQAESSREYNGRTPQDRIQSAAKASDVIGMHVKNYQDESLGKVEDLAVDVESGRIVQVILSSGGLVGIGDRLTALPPGALHHDVINKVLHLESTRTQVKAAPEFKNSAWAESFDPVHLAATSIHFGQEPGTATHFIHTGATNTPAQTAPTRNADGTWSKARLGSEAQWMIPASRLGQIQSAKKLMGLAVQKTQDEKLGKVDNFLVDVQSGRILAVVVSSGGFLGMGDELSAVPPTALRFHAEPYLLHLDTTREALAAAPHFKSNQWPDFSEPAYSDSVYRAYKVEPYFTTNAVYNADATARNVRDQGNRSLKPLDQGNSQADVSTTARIRKGIMDGQDMSVSAKNVKIFTNQGMVTLRGSVDSSEEKRLIGDIANTIASVENVDNQLVVK